MGKYRVDISGYMITGCEKIYKKTHLIDWCHLQNSLGGGFVYLNFETHEPFGYLLKARSKEDAIAYVYERLQTWHSKRP